MTTQPPGLPPTAARPDAFGPDRRRWAERARAVQYDQLSSVRRTAEQWRTGLAGLTALLSVGSLLAGPDVAARLSSGWRALVGLLTLAGLLTLVFATWRAMQSAFGVPGDDMPLTGERLKAWEHDEARRALRAFRSARIGFLCGLLLVIGAATIAFAATSRPGLHVLVTSDSAVVCGELRASDPGTVALREHDGTGHVLELRAVRTVASVAEC